jgi:hypothetical protein
LHALIVFLENNTIITNTNNNNQKMADFFSVFGLCVRVVVLDNTVCPSIHQKCSGKQRTGMMPSHYYFEVSHAHVESTVRMYE